MKILPPYSELNSEPSKQKMTFRMKILPPYSELNSEPSKQKISIKQEHYKRPCKENITDIVSLKIFIGKRRADNFGRRLFVD
jgi:hypothetical protein